MQAQYFCSCGVCNLPHACGSPPAGAPPPNCAPQVSLSPEWSKGRYRLGSCLLLLERCAEAAEAFKEAARLDPDSKEAAQGVAKAEAAAAAQVKWEEDLAKVRSALGCVAGCMRACGEVGRVGTVRAMRSTAGS